MVTNSKEYYDKWYSANRVKVLAKKQERRSQLRARLRKLKEGLRCQFCGEAHPACLDFHHRENTGKRFDLGKAASSGFGWDTILAEINKCIPLCANCHRKLHDEG